MNRLERRFEGLIWKFRLVTLIPVCMSLLGSLSCFVIGTYAEISVLKKVIRGDFTHDNSTLLIGKVEEELLPNRLCSYLFELSQVFNRFYDQVPVLKAGPDALPSRLASVASLPTL